MNERELTIHEAGHVVVAALMGAAPDSWVRAGHGGGYTEWEQLEPQATAAIAIAGAVANAIADNPQTSFLAVMTRLRGLLNDAERDEGAILSDGDAERVPTHLFGDAVATAYTMLRKHASLHAAYAEQLAATGVLTSEQAKQLLENSLGGV